MPKDVTTDAPDEQEERVLTRVRHLHNEVTDLTVRLGRLEDRYNLLAISIAGLGGLLLLSLLARACT